MSQTQENPGRGSGYETPRWVKIAGVVVIVLVVLAGVTMLTGHNPLAHMQHPISGPTSAAGTAQP